MSTPLPDLSGQLSLGEPVLDHEHRQFLRLVEELQTATPDTLIPCLEALSEHARMHFGQEDIDLRDIGGEVVQCHLDEHSAVLQSLSEVRHSLEQAKPIGVTELQLVQRLVQEFLRWLPEHVQVMDGTVANYRSKRRLGGAPVLIRKKV
jgi:hemerythrin